MLDLMLTIFSQNSKVSECNGELKGLSLFLYFIFSYMWAINQVFYKKKKIHYCSSGKF